MIGGRGERRGEDVRIALCVAVCPLKESWRTEKPLQEFQHPKGFVKYVERLSEERTPPGKGASLGKEAVLADSREAGEISAGVGG